MKSVDNPVDRCESEQQFARDAANTFDRGATDGRLSLPEPSAGRRGPVSP